MEKKGKQDGEHRRHIAGGHIKVARRLKESAIWSQDPHYLRLWTYLLLSVRWDEKPIKKGVVTIGRGQVLKSFRRIAEENEWTENRALKRWSTSRVKRMIDWLSENEMVSLHGTELGTLITIKNFNGYQDPESYRLEPGTEPGTQSERSRNNRKKDKKENTTKPPSFYDDVAAVFEYWVEKRAEVLNLTRRMKISQSSTDRLSKVKARLAEGHTVADLMLAIDGCLGSQHNVEGGFVDLELICRNDQKVTQYMAWARKNGRGSGTRHMTAAEVEAWDAE